LINTQVSERSKDFEENIIKHIKSLFFMAYKLTDDKCKAEDLTQDTIFRALKYFDKFEPGTNPRAWLSRIMMNIFINNYHRRKREIRWDYENNPQSDYLEVKTIGERQQLFPRNGSIVDSINDKLKSALNKLPKKYRKAIVLFDLSGHTYKETADILGCAIGTVKSRLFRGRQKLRGLLRDYSER